jgi:drug/metabolite transporter (DMT)-like permease
MVLVGIIIVTTDIPFSSSSIPVINLGNFLVILATVFWAIDNNLSKNITYKVDVARLAQLKSLIGGSILLLIVFLMGISINIDAAQLLHIFILGSVGFAASLYFFLQSLKRIGTVRTILMFSMSSVFGLIFAILFLKEDIGIYQVGAIAIIISGIYLMTRE